MRQCKDATGKEFAMKKMISICLSALLILSMCGVSVAAGNEAKLENETKANEYNTKMVVYFEQESGYYPSHYGGAYINDEGNLVICVTEDSQEIREEYYRISGADKLEFKQVKYSLNELYEIAMSANRYAESTGKIPKPETSILRQRENRVELCISEQTLKECSNQLSGEEKIYVNDFEYKDAVDFKVSGELVLEASAGGPGYGINTKSSSGSVGSIGYLAHRNNNGVEETGFVTAGHTIPMVSSNRIVYNSNGERIGICTFTNGQFTENGDVQTSYTGNSDVAFVKLDDNATIGGKIYGTSYYQDISVNYVIPAEGSQIYKSGVMTGVTSGRVYSLYYNNDNDYLSGPVVKRILATYSSNQGDSGGIIYTVSGGKARVVGIHQGTTMINNIKYRVAVTAYVLQNDSQNPIIAGT